MHWIKRFIFWSGKRHPATPGEADVSAFLSHLAVEFNVAAAARSLMGSWDTFDSSGFTANLHSCASRAVQNPRVCIRAAKLARFA